MAYRFRRHDKTCQKAVRRIAQEQIGKAINAIDTAEDPVEPLHDIRKRCKSMRALVKLVRSSFDGYESENETFRHISARLSEFRETQVALDVFDRIVADGWKKGPGESIATYRKVFSKDLRRISDSKHLKKTLSEVRAELADAQDRARKWHLGADGWSAFEAGLARTYETAATRAQALKLDGSPESYHSCRKQVKYHWHHARLLEKIDPVLMTQHSRQTKKLAELLGDHHDLTDFEALLQRDIKGDNRRDAEALAVLTRRQRSQSESRIREQAARLFTQPTEDLVQTWKARWKQHF